MSEKLRVTTDLVVPAIVAVEPDSFKRVEECTPSELRAVAERIRPRGEERSWKDADALWRLAGGGYKPSD